MTDPTRSLPAPDPGRTRTDPGPDPTPGDRPTATSPPVVDTSLADAVGDHFLRLAEPADEGTRGGDAGPVAPPGYELLGEVGRGGMGVVYRARDTAFGRDVAVKLLRDSAAPDSPAARRFLDEARITGQLQHPGIPAAHQVGALSDGRPFLVMRLIKGRTLADLLDDRADPAADRGRFLAVFEQVCQAVGYAHAHRVVHRDLKPANVMVGAFGEVQVMDWGLAKVLTGQGEPATGADPDAATLGTEIRYTRDAAEETQPGSVLGTPAFMPPEQAIGAVDQVDARSDVFGLGAILCVVLTGQPPYVSGTTESTRQLAARARLDDAHARLAGCGVEPELVALCKRCLSPEKGDRPGDAGEVARAVAGLRAAADERARRAELDRVRAEAEAREQRRRRRAQLALAASVGLLLMGGGAVGWWQDRQAADRRAQRARNADALAELVGRCEEGLRADDVDRAAAALAEVDRRLAEGGGETARERADQCRADLAILLELNSIDNDRWISVEGKLPHQSSVAARLPMAFAGYGVKVGEATAGEVAARVTRSLVRDRLLAALDLWLVSDPNPGVKAVLRAADPDPYRDAVRDAIAARDGKRVAELAWLPEALAQPPGFAAAFYRYDNFDPHRVLWRERARPILESALRSQPGNLATLMELGTSYPPDQREGADERLRWFQAAVAAHPRNETAHVYLGVTLQAKGDLDGAIAAIKEAVRLDPGSVVTHSNLGRALSAKGDVDGAIASYRDAIRNNPMYALAHNGLGVALSAKGDLDGAIAALKEAVRLDPVSVAAHANLGGVLGDKGDVDGAIASYRDAIRNNPMYALAHNGLGVALSAKGDLDGAIAALKEAVRLDPVSVAAHANLGRALSAKGEVNRAIASRLDPVSVAAHANLGRALSAKREVNRAIASYREAIRLDPKHTHALIGLGVALWSTSDLDGAIYYLTKAVNLSPLDASARASLGGALHAKGDHDGAIACLQEALRLDPKYPSAHTYLGLALQAKGDLDGAVAAFREVVRLDPKDAGAHSRLGSALRSKGDHDGAVACLQEAIRLDPKNPSAYDRLGLALQAKGDLDGAVAAFREVVRLDPKDASARNNLGNALRDKGDLDGAITCFREQIRLYPMSDRAHMNLVRVLVTKGDKDGAVATYKEALRIDPNSAMTHNDLAWLLATGPDGVRDGHRAVEHATRACVLTGWKDVNKIDTLAAAYAEAGDFDKAVEHQENALSSPTFPKAEEAASRQRLALYVRKMPYRDPTFVPREVAPPPRPAM